MTERSLHMGLEESVSGNSDPIGISKPGETGRAGSALNVFIYRTTLFVGGLAMGMAVGSGDAGYEHAKNFVSTGFVSLFAFPLIDRAFANRSGRDIAERVAYITPGMLTGLYLMQTIKQF
ncbi:MAG: hypothetical protein IIA87_01275 [Nanoarchaeota archaeon]|nr:hypothetical protein [Nanoarchaeota archaeon]